MDDKRQVLTFVVDEPTAGDRLDRFVAAMTGRGRVQARRLLEEGRVQVGGRPQKKAYLVRPADVVTVRLWSEQVAHEGALSLVLVRDDLVIADKPRGLPTVAVRDGASDTLASRLLSRFPEMADVGYSKREPGVLHRLDNDTSGLVVAARDRATFDSLRRTMDDGLWVKRYLCLVHGELESTNVTRALAPDPKSARRVVPADEATSARDDQLNTVFEALKLIDALPQFEGTPSLQGPFTFVRATITKGYRHQIRAHAALLGHPLVGDTRYQGTEHRLLETRAALETSGQLLHAAEIAFPDPARPEERVSAIAAAPAWIGMIDSR